MKFLTELLIGVAVGVVAYMTAIAIIGWGNDNDVPGLKWLWSQI